MTDFSKAVIYGIYCKDKNVLEIYIGSAHDAEEREKGHKDVWNNENSEKYNLKVYLFIRENGGWDNWIFKVIEEFPCDNDIELRIREQYHYDLLNPELNMIRPYTSEEDRKEYQRIYDAKRYQDNRDEILKQIKKNYEKNRDEILKRNNQKFTCKCGKEYTFGNRLRHCDSKRHKEFLANRLIENK